jgi:glycosyltransferase involved in cell wall biosynthesis
MSDLDGLSMGSEDSYDTNGVPLVSIVVPTFNRASLVSETLDSVYAQTFKDFEVIVVDDGSTDETVKIISTNYPDAHIIQQEHRGGGGAEARSTGIHAARGQYIAFLDSDDIWFPQKLEYQLSRLESDHNLMWIYSDAQVFDSKTGDVLYLFSQLNPLQEGDVLEKLVLGDFIPFFTLVVRRTVFDIVGDFWPTPKGTDWDMCLRIAAHYPIEVIRKPLGCYRVHSSAVTAKQGGMLAFTARTEIVERAIARNPERLEVIRKRARSRMCLGTGKELARSGNLKQARKLFQEAIVLTPGMKEAYIYWLGCLLGKNVLGTMITIKHHLRKAAI